LHQLTCVLLENMLEKNNIYSTKTIKVKKKNLANPLNTHTHTHTHTHTQEVLLGNLELLFLTCYIK